MGYGTTARMFHWVVGLLVLSMIPVGMIMVQEGLARPVQDRLFIYHKGMGAVLLLLVALRVVWRLFNPAPPLPASMPAWQQIASKISHFALYALLVVMVVSGYVRTVGGGFPIELMDWLGIPTLLPRLSDPVVNAAQTIHFAAGRLLVLAILIHVAAALYHALIRRDGVMARIWPPVAPGR